MTSLGKDSSVLERFMMRAEDVGAALASFGGKKGLLDAAESCIPDLPCGHRSCYLNFGGQKFFVSFKGLLGNVPTETFVFLDMDRSVVYAYRRKD